MKGWRLRGELALARRRWDDAEHALRQALEVAQSIGNPTQLWKTHVALASLGTGRHRGDLAQQEWEAARQVINRVRDNIRHRGLRTSFASRPMIRQVLEFEPPR